MYSGNNMMIIWFVLLVHARKDAPFKLRSSNKKGVGIVEKEN